jgi:hypothetical protein
MKIRYDLASHLFYFQLLSVIPGDSETYVDGDAVILLNAHNEWIGLDSKRSSPHRLLWGTGNDAVVERPQEVVVDWRLGKTVGIEVFLWIENRDVGLRPVVEAAQASQDSH